MIGPEFHIRDAVETDMELIRTLFYSEGFGTLTDPTGVRVAITPDNVMYGACRCEQGSDGSWNVRPIVVFDAVQGKGVGRALLEDALRLHHDLKLVSRGSAEPFYLACGMQRGTWDDIAPEYVEECNLCPDRDVCAPQVYVAAPKEHVLTFLGTSSGCGVPAFFCHCPACEQARRDPSKRRGCTGVVVQSHGTTLIDTPPDLRQQLLRENVESIDELFLTHAHYDHLGGFGELEYYIRLCRGSALPFHASAYAMTEAFKEFEYMDDCFVQDPMQDFETRYADGLSIQALPLNHAPGTFGYLMTTPEGRSCFYAPDTADLRPDVIEVLRGTNTIIMDATFWKNAGAHTTHHFVKDTVREGLELLGAEKVILQHLAPHMCDDGVNEIEEIYKYADQFDGRVIVAEDGMKVKL